MLPGPPLRIRADLAVCYRLVALHGWDATDYISLPLRF